MMKIRSIGPSLLLLAALPLALHSQAAGPAAGASPYLEKLRHFVELRDSVRDVHPFLSELHPVAVVDGGQYYIFDADATGKVYAFIKSAPAPDSLPKGIRAAFPLDAYDWRMVCVVSPDAFDTTEGLVLMLHEFVHCGQWEHGEAGIKERLGIAQEAMKKKDYMWELRYRFPYSRVEVARTYAAFMRAAREGKAEALKASRRALRKLLKPDEFEYMTWEEFKEGLARFVENQIRRKLGIPENHAGGEMVLSRIAFYEGGSSLIALLCRNDSALSSDLPRLYKIMRDR
jgi:hypothetical protein